MFFYTKISIFKNIGSAQSIEFIDAQWKNKNRKYWVHLMEPIYLNIKIGFAVLHIEAIMVYWIAKYMSYKNSGTKYNIKYRMENKTTCQFDFRVNS